MHVWVEQLRCWGLGADDVGWSVSVAQTPRIDLRDIGEVRRDRGDVKLRAGPFLVSIGVENVGGGCYCLSVGEDKLTIGGNHPHGTFFAYDESVVKTMAVGAAGVDDQTGPDGGRGRYRACFELCW